MKKRAESVRKSLNKRPTKEQIIANFKHLQERNPAIDLRPMLRRELEKLESA